MNVTTLIFLGLAVVWAIVLLPEVLRKLAVSRRSDSISSFNQQLSVLHRSGSGPESGRSNVIDLRSRAKMPARRQSTGRPVPASVRKRRQEVLTALGSASVLTLICAVAFGGLFLVLFLLSSVLLVAYVVALTQVNQSSAASSVAGSFRTPTRSADNGLRTATVGRSSPAPRRIAN